MTIVNRMLFLAMSAFAALAWMPASADDQPPLKCPPIYGEWRVRYYFDNCCLHDIAELGSFPNVIAKIRFYRNKAVVTWRDNKSAVYRRTHQYKWAKDSFYGSSKWGAVLSSSVHENPPADEPNDKCYAGVMEFRPPYSGIGFSNMRHHYLFEKVE